MTVGVAARGWAGLARCWHRGVADRAAAKVGGLARLQVIVLLACVLGLQSADNATVGAIAAPLSKDLGIGNTQIVPADAGLAVGGVDEHVREPPARPGPGR